MRARNRPLVAAYGAHVVAWRSWKWQRVWGPEGSMTALREDLSEVIYRITPAERPFSEVLKEWSTDALKGPDDA